MLFCGSNFCASGFLDLAIEVLSSKPEGWEAIRLGGWKTGRLKARDLIVDNSKNLRGCQNIFRF